jgi:hypothetical protein
MMIPQRFLARKIEALYAQSLLLTLFLWLFVSPALVAAPNSQTVDAYHLTQTHFALGPLELYYTADAVKMQFKSKGLFLLARAPSWKVVIFRPEGHVAHEISQKEFLANGMSWVQFGGIPLRGYKGVAEQKGRNETLLEYVYAGAPSPNSSQYTYWEVKPVGLKVPDEACELAARAFRVPYRHNIPFKLLGNEPGHDDMRPQNKVAWSLSVDTRKAGGRTEIWRLATSKCTSVKLPKSEFDYPVGYRMVKSEPEVIISSGSREVIEDLLGSDTPVSALKKEQKR